VDRTIPGKYVADGHLRLGYAATCHASQGSTVERAVVAGYPDEMFREWGNTAFCRARGETHVCVLGGEGRDAELAEYVHVSADRKRGDDRAMLIRSLAESRGPVLAIDEIDRGPGRLAAITAAAVANRPAARSARPRQGR
jgi:hypothetical protein